SSTAGYGCDWQHAAPSPDAFPEPFTSISIVPGTSNEKLAGKDQIQVPLTIINNGTVEIQSIQIDEVPLLRTVGSGHAMLADPLLP
ncbi:MAG TPA: hypothetical protein VK670_09795, partial [Silvibacterium sp.]|nr:hypothetical protein [Silvibacterium sp.]